MALANTGSLQTNFNVDPFYDDYNESKNFHRILFKPGLAVQARELTQLQTILQNQIDRFGEHIFKEGSVVRGNELTYDSNLSYVKILDLAPDTSSVDVTNFKSLSISGDTSGASAYVVDVVSGTEGAAPDTKTFFIKYTNSGTDNITKTFTDNELLTANTGGWTATTLASASTGKSSRVTLGGGVIYAKDNFIRVDEQSIIVGKYSSNTSIKVGYDIVEEIVSFTDDTTLLDPAQGAYNYAAPGGDRLKLTAVLVTKDLADTDTINFVERLRIKNGRVEERLDKPEYNVINDYIARRTYDESGDYIVNGLNVKVREHLKVNDNGGLYVSPTGNTNLLSVDVTPGKAYIRGYETEVLSTEHVIIEKGIDSVTVDDATLSASYGNYVEVAEVVGSWNIDAHSRVSLYNAAAGAVSNNTYSATTPSGTKIGEARVRALDYVTGAKGSAAAKFNLYIYDISMTANTFSAVKGIYYNDGVKDGLADPVLVANSAVLKDSAFNNALVKVPGSFTKDLKDSVGAIDTDWTAIKKYSSAVVAGVITLDTSGGVNEALTISSSPTLSQRGELYNVYVSSGSANTNVLDTTVSLSAADPGIVTGVTSALSRYNAGDLIQLGTSAANRYSVISVDSDTQLTVSNPGASAFGPDDLYKYFVPGLVVDLSGKGSAGGDRTSTWNSTTEVEFDLNESGLGGTLNVDIVAEIKVENSGGTTKTLSANSFVTLDTSSHPNTTTGPWCLGVPDGYQLAEVRYKTGSQFVADTEGVDVTSDFELDTGMRDNHYARAALKLKSTSNRVIASGDKFLVKFNYFTHGAYDKFFSVDSYSPDSFGYENIPLYTSPVDGITYNLRDYADFRSVMASSATPNVSVGSAPQNPVDTGVTINSGIRFIAPNETMTTSFNYYLPRKDRIVITSKGVIQSIRGVSSLNPQTPPGLGDGLTIAIVDVKPSPSLPYDNAIAINREDLANEITPVRQVRYTMKDIGVLKNRIENLEYYTSLSLLENNTKNLTISDANGLNRFKNGILVDQFTGHNVGNVKNLDYKIAVDPKLNEIRPTFKNDEVLLEYNSGTSTNVTLAGELLMLPYTEEKLISQPFASDLKNLTAAFYSYNGTLTLSPDNDYWIDTKKSPDVQINFDFNTDAWSNLANAWGTQWGSWSDIWTSTSTRTSATATQINTTNTTQTGQQLTGTKFEVGVPLTQTQSTGEFVKNVNVIPFMRSRMVQFTGQGLKPGTLVYPWFDDTSVSSYCSPANSSFANTASEGSSLITDSTGTIYGLFRIPDEPAQRFRTGSLIFKLTDSVTGSSVNSTTFAAGRYTADGMSQVVGETVISTRQPQISLKSVTSNRIVTSTSTTSVSVPPPVTPWWDNDDDDGDGGDGDDPLAQTFRLNLNAAVSSESSSSGAFLTKLELFFNSKDSTQPIIVEIREVDPSLSIITGRIVPFGRAIIPAASVNASPTDSTVATTVTFDTPVYLLNDTEYAFVVKPGANNPNASLWISRLGENDLASGNRITKQPYSGILFSSSNDKTYSPIQEEDIKFNAYFANFGTNQTGTLKLNNDATDVLTLSDPAGVAIATVGEAVHGETELVLGGNIVGANVGEELVDVVTGANGTITFTSGAGTYRLRSVTDTKFTTSNTVTLYQSGIATANTNTISSQTTPIAIVKSYDDSNFANTYLHMSNSNGLFAAGTWVKGQINSGEAYIVSVNDLNIDLVHTYLGTYNLDKTFVTGQYKLATGPSTPGTVYQNVNVNNDTVFGNRKYVLSKSNEVANISGAKSADIELVLKNTNNTYHSPVIDSTRMAILGVENIVNNDSTNEDLANGGNAVAKYITKTVTLAEGQDAEDLKAYITAYQPSWTNINVYCKILNAEDGDTMSVRPWIQMSRSTNNNVISDSENEFDYKEFEFDIPSSLMTGENAEVQYLNSQSVTYTGFKRFAIKIVLLSSNTSKVPRVKDLSVIALQI